MKKFSIIIPVYDVEPYLKRCLDSVVKQTLNDYEAIIVCDKCHDNSEKIVDEYVHKYKQLKKIYAEKTGLSKARNLGVDVATGDYLLFLDGDDFLQLDCLEVLSQNMFDIPDLIRIQVQDVSGNDVIKHEEESFSTMLGVEAFTKIIRYHYVENAWSYCYRSQFYKRCHFQFMEGCIAEDYGLLPLVIAKAKKVKSLSYIGYNYVQRENSLMSETNYSKKVKKMDDMLKQAAFLKKELEVVENKDVFIRFIQNSLIYYSTRLKYKDYKKYRRILKKMDCFSHLHEAGLKPAIRNQLIKWNAYVFYRYIVR